MVLLILLISVLSLNAQILTPIKWTTSVEMSNETDGVIIFKAEIEDGWHLYSTDFQSGGPKPTEIVYNKLEGVELTGGLTSITEPVEAVDKIFNLKLAWWTDNAELKQAFKLTNNNGYQIEGCILYQGCNDKTCIAPQKENFEFSKGGITVAPVQVADVKVENKQTQNKSAIDESAWWKPVEMPVGEDAPESTATASLWYIFFMGFIGGFVALLTPCVWPMIPMTVSFFLKKNTSKAKSITDAAIYGVGIILIYLILGLTITLIFGASKLNDLSTNAVFNLLFFAILVIFAISFFGAFDIKLPSKWSNSMDNKAERTSGLLSIIFMAFTLALVSFSCTGPIMGTLLVEAATIGDVTGPAIGMFGFALALALPFTLFAIFPSWLKEMPRSGGWLNSVKVVLGFLELALSLKFLSVADLAYGWGILDREVFISLWVVIFALLGFYLLGKLRFSHDEELQSVSVPRFFMALVSLSFAIYLIPGLWGAPLKSVSAFVPPMHTQDFSLYDSGEFKEFDDYNEGMKYAAQHNLPVLIDFSGHGCVNCRKMEGAVFDTPQVRSIIQSEFVLIKLMVDDKKALETPYNVIENGKKMTISTVGEEWSYLQRVKFKANSQPYYVVLDNNGNPLTPATYYDEDINKFVNWLQSGLENYQKANN